MRRPGHLNPTLAGWAVLVPVLALCAVGIMSLLSLGSDQGQALGRLAVRQVAYVLAGLALVFLILTTHYQRIGDWSYLLFAVLVALLSILVLARFVPIPLIPKLRGACRWIVLPGFSVQPSEVMKVVYVLALAYYLRYRKNYRNLPGLVGPFALTLLPIVLILLEPDLGMSVLLLPVLFAMLFAAGAKKRHLVPIVMAGLAAVPLLYLFVLADYQKTRIHVVLRQNDDDPRWRMDEGYQLHHSKTALASGRILGTTFGDGWMAGPYLRHRILPDQHNDFIFSIIAHQWGMVGALVVLACYALIVLVGFEIATLTNDPFGRLLAVGLSVMLASQTLVNVGMTMGLTPTTGLNLPFVSSGGSSMLTNFAAVGLLINIAQRRPVVLAPKPFEFSEEDES